MRLRYFFVVCLIAGLVYWYTVQRPHLQQLTVGTAAPEFALADREGRIVRSEDLRGKVLLVHFWATWCASCAEEVPALNILAARFAGQPFLIVGISEDGESGGGWAAIDAFRRRIPVQFLLLLDPDGKIADNYGTFGIPESYLIDRQGLLRRKFTGPVTWGGSETIGVIEQALHEEGHN
ncbi:MAG: TlpA family protein disulfide reductase [Deltaproteobacteria bacterium]|nr:TlpA family protein disulfide reductase [Deltaproteobacteria bacterium]